MKQRRFTVSHIEAILKDADADVGVSEICRRHGISVTTYRYLKRRYGGMSASDLERLMSEEFKLRGKTYASLKACYEDHKELAAVAYENFWERFKKKGWTLERALFEPPAKSDRIYVVKGREFSSINAAYEAFKDRIGISLPGLLYRIENGMELEQALFQPKKPGHKDGEWSHYSPEVVEGIEYANLTEIANTYGVSPNALFKRYREGKRGDQLVAKEIAKRGGDGKRKQKRKVANSVDKHAGKLQDDCKKREKKFLGEEFSTWAELYRSHESDARVSYATFYKRVMKGWDIKDALIAPSRKPRKIKFRGRLYESKSQIAEAHGIGTSTLYQRLWRKMTLEEAIDAGPDKIRREGVYSEKVLAETPGLAEQQAWLYFVSLDFGGTKFHKIGITTRSARSRLSSTKYELKVLREIPGKLIDCYRLEQSLLDRMGDKRAPDLPVPCLAGHTEMLQLNNSEVRSILNFLDQQNF